MPRPCHVIRVFTRGDEGGNHLGVVTDSSGLDPPDMQNIARDLAFSETIFLEPGAPPRVRIFTPGREMPFAGHPLVGINWLIRELGLPETDRLICGIGEVGVGYEGDLAWVEVPVERPVRPVRDLNRTATMLRLSTPTSANWVDMPIPYLLIELPRPEDVATASVGERNLEQLAVGELYLFSPAGENRIKARFFAPEAGVFEDPATGSAAVALASMLAHRGRRAGDLTIDQGDELGHPSTIFLSWRAKTIRIGGTARSVEQLLLER